MHSQAIIAAEATMCRRRARARADYGARALSSSRSAQAAPPPGFRELEASLSSRAPAMTPRRRQQSRLRHPQPGGRYSGRKWRLQKRETIHRRELGSPQYPASCGRWPRRRRLMRHDDQSVPSATLAVHRSLRRRNPDEWAGADIGRARTLPAGPARLPCVRRGGDGAARVIADTTSPSQRLALAWRSPSEPPVGRAGRRRAREHVGAAPMARC